MIIIPPPLFKCNLTLLPLTLLMFLSTYINKAVLLCCTPQVPDSLRLPECCSTEQDAFTTTWNTATAIFIFRSSFKGSLGVHKQRMSKFHGNVVLVSLRDVTFAFNLWNPTGFVMHQQFNIQQLYVLPTLYLCVLYLSENKQRLVPLTA